jgi:hypothetical protein
MFEKLQKKFSAIGASSIELLEEVQGRITNQMQADLARAKLVELSIILDEDLFPDAAAPHR